MKVFELAISVQADGRVTMALGKILRSGVLAAVACSLLTACSESNFDKTVLAESLPAPDPAYTVKVDEYRISPNDKLNITVFPIADFTSPTASVDAGGNIILPRVGTIQASGKTARELSRELEATLKACCLQNPQVVVQVNETTSQQIVVTGAVVASDVYNLRGSTTLLKAITLAKGPDRATANLKRVAVFRTIDGKRMGALFDVAAIRDGRAEDPQIFGGDTIVVDSSRSKSVWRSAVSAVPFFGVFSGL